MKTYRLINNITGWAVFLIAAITYLLTIEPTASLWDCGEFIASGFKLEVGHPPGNPVFMVLARFFTLFAGGDVSRVAAMVNAMSALASAFTILFLFWTITHLARKVILKEAEHLNEGNINIERVIAVMASGAVGALAYTFSDSFWFSAVEGEVYATSSLFTALVFWAILKWEDAADDRHADRWIILIAYLMGLSIGVHLLNLLALPAIVMIYYFKKYGFSGKGIIVSLGISVVLLSLIMYGIMPGIVKISSKFDLFFVNTLGLPPNSGMLVHVLLIVTLFILAMRSVLRSQDKTRSTVLAAAALFFTGIWVISGSGLLNFIVLAVVAVAVWYIAGKSRSALATILTSLMVILIGYSTNAIVVIRSSANPPLDENNPENPFNLLYFLNREQYGERPLFSGAYYNAPVLDYKDGKPKYSFDGDKYIVTSHNLERIYDERFITFFPRMWSDQPDHREVYEQWGGVKGIPLQVTNPQSGEKEVIRKPTFGENLRFMFTYQFGYMYFRYFMWNFAGRQNDVQGTGGAINGNWISGLSFLDESRTGTYDLPADMKNDPSRNKYYLLPFVLGIAGLFWQLSRDRQNWWVVLALFIMTGIAIVIYLNQYPNQPRERDYAYVGSFYFFAVWIGLGVLALFDALSRLMPRKIAAPVAAVICLLAVPVVMGAENWDDHDRSGRYLTRDVAFNYLESCAPDAILFTNGDNDTFPLWYAQEVEGKRRDVRVCNLMLLNTDWYINQMKTQNYESEPLPISFEQKKYYDGVNNQVFIYERTKDPVEISTVIDWVKSDNKATKLQYSGELLDIIPTRILRIPVDRAKVLSSGTVKPEDADKIVPYIDIVLKGGSILKSQLMILDMLAHNNWERPIYFVTGYHNDAMGLEEYFQLEGLAYRLVPIKSQNKSWLEYGRIDSDILYANMMKKFDWESSNDDNVYLDFNHKRTLMVIKARLNYARLAKALALEGKNEKAVEVLDYCMQQFPPDKLPYDQYMPDMIEAYFRAGATEKATELTKLYTGYSFSHLDYYMSQRPHIIASAEYEIQSAIQNVSKTASYCATFGQKELGDELSKKIESYYTRYVMMQEPSRTINK